MLQYFIPYFPKTSARTTNFVVKFSKKSSGPLKSKTFSAVGLRPFRILIPALFLARKRQRISNLAPVQLLNIPVFTYSVTY